MRYVQVDAGTQICKLGLMLNQQPFSTTTCLCTPCQEQRPIHYLHFKLSSLTEITANEAHMPEAFSSHHLGPFLCFARPQDGEELAGFMKYVIALHRAHIMLSTLVQPLEASDRRSSARAQEVLDSHKRCEGCGEGICTVEGFGVGG